MTYGFKGSKIYYETYYEVRSIQTVWNNHLLTRLEFIFFSLTLHLNS